MVFDWRGIVLGCAVVALIYFSGLAGRLVPISAADRFGNELAKVVSCTSKKDAVHCAVPMIRQMLTQKNPSDVMDALAEKLPALQCHYIGHLVGQQLYHDSKNVESSIAACNYDCDSACTHGIIGEAFAETLGFASVDDAGTRQSLDLEHLSPDEILSVGKKLCTSAQTCHGVGHALFQAYGKFDPALRVCQEVADSFTLHYCYIGVFMEYADTLSSRTIRPAPGVTFPTPDQLTTLCTFKDLQEKRACFWFHTRMTVETYMNLGLTRNQAQDKEQALCEAYTNIDDRVACIAGFGASESYLVAEDTGQAVLACNRFDNLHDRAACQLGEISALTEDRRQNLVAMCPKLGTDAEQKACYQEIFYFLDQSRASATKLTTLCPAGNSMCAAGYDARKQDAWANIPSN